MPWIERLIPVVVANSGEMPENPALVVGGTGKAPTFSRCRRALSVQAFSIDFDPHLTRI